MRLVSTLTIALIYAALMVRPLAQAAPRTLPVWIAVQVAVMLGLLGVWNVIFTRFEHRRISRLRAEDYTEHEEAGAPEAEIEDLGALGRWLALAGYRRPGSVQNFVAITIGMLLPGVLAMLWLRQSALFRIGLHELERFPSAVGEILLPVLYVGPFIVMVVMGCAPWLAVRSARRRIVTEVEQDLPLVLELLATLGESGLGFDAAIERVLASQPAERPLTVEFRAFQRETITGRPRIEAMRRLARRLDVPSLTIFISAIAQAEQVGSGVSGVLRRQAEDARNRRRDRALNLAQSLPVKLLFPLVICFLPAIFVVTLGPIFLQFFKFADALVSKGTPP